MMNGYYSGHDFGALLGAPLIAGTLALLFLTVLLGGTIVQIWLFYRIYKRAGYNGWWGLLSLIPGIGMFIALVVLAFDTWPIHRAPAAAIPATPAVPTPAPDPSPSPTVEPPVPPAAS